jgi:hypothetical protein
MHGQRGERAWCMDREERVPGAWTQLSTPHLHPRSCRKLTTEQFNLFIQHHWNPNRPTTLHDKKRQWNRRTGVDVDDELVQMEGDTKQPQPALLVHGVGAGVVELHGVTGTAGLCLGSHVWIGSGETREEAVVAGGKNGSLKLSTPLKHPHKPGDLLTN